MTFVTNAETNTVKIGIYSRNFNAESEHFHFRTSRFKNFPGGMPPEPPNYARSSHYTLQEKSWILFGQPDDFTHHGKRAVVVVT